VKYQINGIQLLWPCSSLDSLVVWFEWKEENEEDGVIAPSQSAENQLPKVEREQHKQATN
jgi:hypothetical protein